MSPNVRMQPIIHPERPPYTSRPSEVRLPHRAFQTDVWDIIVCRDWQVNELRIGVSLVKGDGGCPCAENDECW